MLDIQASALDYTIIAIYFVVVLGIGFAARRYIKDDADFFLSGRSLPAWVTGLAFVSANLGALEILGMAANGATYGTAIFHFYWIGAVPAMRTVATAKVAALSACVALLKRSRRYSGTERTLAP